MESERSRHAVSTITHHFVWTPKDRRAVLEGAVAGRCVALLRDLVPNLGGEPVELVVRPDHVHLFGHFPPTIAPYQFAHRLKGATSHVLREEFPELRRRLPPRWSHGYCVGTAGNVPCDSFRTYIEARKGR